jgi:hypothetical protein
MQGGYECGINLQNSFRRFLKGLIGRLADVAQA